MLDNKNRFFGRSDEREEWSKFTSKIRNADQAYVGWQNLEETIFALTRASEPPPDTQRVMFAVWLTIELSLVEAEKSWADRNGWDLESLPRGFPSLLKVGQTFARVYPTRKAVRHGKSCPSGPDFAGSCIVDPEIQPMLVAFIWEPREGHPSGIEILSDDPDLASGLVNYGRPWAIRVSQGDQTLAYHEAAQAIAALHRSN